MENREQGFTLIEVVIAIAVLSFGILALQTMQGLSIDENSNASAISSKSMLAADQIEQILDMAYDSPPLDDRDGDGTNQDPDQNGIDNNDNANINDTLINEEFGLRHSQCCPGGVDPRGNAVAGCVAIADQCGFYEDYDIYWNIAVDHPVTNTKTITIIVVNPKDRINQIPGQVNRAPNRAEYTYHKVDVI